jgi:hypothetical protein
MKIFENVAQLRLARLGTGQLVKTKGYYTANDGGGAEYIIVATGTGTDDGGSYIDLALNQARLVVRNSVNAKQFGIVGDGIADDSDALESARNIAISLNVDFVLNDRVRTTRTFTINASNLNVYFKSNAAILPDDDVLIGVFIGTNTGVSIPTRMKIDRLKVDRTTVDVSTENVGIFYGAFNQSDIYSPESRFSKYNFKGEPENGGFAYNNIYNQQAIGHVRGLWLTADFAATGGFANENKFFGGRYFDAGVMEYQIYLGSTQVNNNHFYGPSVEGSGISAIYCNGFQNYFVQPRFEGTWSTAQLEFGVDSLLNYIIDNSLYLSTIIDNSTNPSGNSYETARFGSKRVYGVNDTGSELQRTGSATTTALQTLFENQSSGNSFVQELRHTRDNATSFAFKSVRDSDGLVRSSLTTDGRMRVARQFISEQSSFVFEPIVLGSYRLWIDSTGRLFIRNGAPVNETDGTVVGTQT